MNMDSLELSQIQQMVLVHLYRMRMIDRDCYGYHLDPLRDMSQAQVSEILHPLLESALVLDTGSSFRIALAPHAVQLVENALLQDDPEGLKHRKDREGILLALARVRDEEGSQSLAGLDELGASGIDESTLNVHLEVLAKVGMIKRLGPQAFRITQAGYGESQVVKTRNDLQESFRTISGLIPQKRGIEFQRLLGRLLEFQGWRQQEGVKTEEEEIDVVINRGFEYFLFECKWEKDPIGAAVIREFFGKLFKRSQTKGIVVSHSGFTTPAATEAENFFSHRPILLMGPEDIEELVSFKRSFEEIVAERYDLLVTKRISIFR